MSDDERLAQYLRADELQLAFNFKLLTADGRADAARRPSSDSLAAVADTPAPACWVLSNHDRPRHVTRYGGGALGTAPGAGGRAAAAGAARGRLPLQRRRAGPARRRPARRGAAGPDLGAVGRTERGRDACRVPLPWSGTEPPLRLLDGTRDVAADARGLGAADRGGAGRRPCVDAVAVPSGARAAVRRRRPFAGESLEWLPAPDGCLAFRRPGGLVCLVNLSGAAIALPEGRVLLASDDVGDGRLPADTAVWLQA